MIFNPYSYYPYPPYVFIDTIQYLGDIIPIDQDVPLSVRIEQIDARYDLVKDSIVIKRDYPETYSKIISDLEYASTIIGLISEAHGLKCNERVCYHIREVCRKNYQPFDIQKVSETVIRQFYSLGSDKFLGFLHYIETHNLADVKSHRRVVDMQGEYRQYKINRIIS